MKAAVFDAFGPPDVLHLSDVADPGSLGPRDVLVRVEATSVNFGDTLVRNLAHVSPRSFHMPWLFWLLTKITFGWRRPRIRVLGSEYAGTVAARGRESTRFAAGDAVFGYLGTRMGGYAEYLVVRDDSVVAPMPATITFAEAAGCPYGALTAFGVVRALRLRPGERVLVVGASGNIGTYLVQLARHAGAAVTGVCGPGAADAVASFGADHVIDYTREHFADRGETFDTVIDVLGTSSFARCRRVLAPRGRLVYLSFKSPQLLRMFWTACTGGPQVRCLLVNERQEDLVAIASLVAAGVLRCPVDRIFPLSDAAAAHRYAEDGAQSGAVVIAPVAGVEAASSRGSGAMTLSSA